MPYFCSLLCAIFLSAKSETEQFVVDEILNKCINMILDTHRSTPTEGELKRIYPEHEELVKVRGDSDLPRTDVLWGKPKDGNHPEQESSGVRV